MGPAFPLGNRFISQDGIDVFGLNLLGPPVAPTPLTLEATAHGPGAGPKPALILNGVNTAPGGLFNPNVAVGGSPVFLPGLTGDAGQIPYLPHHDIPASVGKYVAHYVTRIPYNFAIAPALGAGAPYNIDLDVYLTSVNPAPVVLTAQAASGLHVNIYNAVTGAAAGATTIAQKNQIMVDVAAAIAAPGQTQVGRDNAITVSVNANGAQGGYAAALIAAVDAEHAIAALAPPVVLTAQAASGLTAGIYNEITGGGNVGATTIAQKNQIMVDVAAAIAVAPPVQVARDLAINNSVAANGNAAGYAGDIIAAVNADHAIAALAPPVVLGGEVLVAVPQQPQHQQQGVQAFVQPSSGRIIYQRR